MSKGTTLRNVRVPNDLWGAALRCAQEHDTTVSEAIRALLQAWVDGAVTHQQPPAAPPTPEEP